MHVNACTIVQPKPATDERAEQATIKAPAPVAAPRVGTQNATPVGQVECAFVTSVMDDDVISDGNSGRIEPILKISPLQYINVVVNGEKLKALNDSGTQVPVVRRSVLKDVAPVGQTQIQGVVGDPIATPLVALDVKLAR